MNKTKRRRLRKGAIVEALLILTICIEVSFIIYLLLTMFLNQFKYKEVTTASNDTPIVQETETTQTSTQSIITTTTPIPKSIMPNVEVYKMKNESLNSESELKLNYSKYSDSEINLLAGLIEAEGGIASETTRKRIGCTVLNRVDSELFPNTIYDVISQSGQYETYICNLIPEYPAQENIRIAKELLDQYYSNNWDTYCRILLLSEKVVYQANSSVDQSSYSYTTLDEYGAIGEYEYHMVYGEAIQDSSNAPYNVSYMY